MKKFHRKLLFPIIWVLLCSSSLYAQKVRVEDLKFKGNKQVSSGKLQKAIRTQANPWYRFFIFWKKSKIYDEDIFLSDLLRVEKFYHQEGYLEAKVRDFELEYNKKSDEVNIVILVEEGEPTRVERVRFQYIGEQVEKAPPEKLRRMMKLKKGKRYREEDLKLDHAKLTEWFGNNGYPYIDVKVKPIVDRQQHLVTLEWRLAAGPFSYFGEIQYSGNNSISEKSIQRGLGFKTGQPFAQKKLATAQRQVYRLELFRFVSLKTTNLDNRPVQIPIEVRVKETVHRTLKVGAGFGSEEGFRGFVQWRHRNFLGGARILRATARHASKLLPLQLQLELSQPYFLSNRNDLIVKPFFIWQDEKSFKARRIGFETTFHRQLSRTNSFFVAARVERDTVEVKGTEVAPELEDLYNKSVVQIGVNHNSSDQIFTPTRGKVSRIVLEQAGLFLRTPFRYIKLFTEHKFYKRLKSGDVFATRIFLGAMTPTGGSADTPIEERFFSGGNYSVRGWGRQLLGPLRADTTGTIVPLGGNSILEGSFELRRPIFKKFSGVVFLDYGNVWPEWNGFDLLKLHYAVGAGLRYNTMIGPIRLDFAWKVNRQELDTRTYEIHVSLGEAF